MPIFQLLLLLGEYETTPVTLSKWPPSCLVYMNVGRVGRTLGFAMTDLIACREVFRAANTASLGALRSPVHS